MKVNVNDLQIGAMIPTNAEIEIGDYPYGYTLRTTLFNSLDFSAKKGYRHVTQTINPKNGRLNNPKKGTYSPLLVRYLDESGHIKIKSFDFNGDEEINAGCNFVSENFGLFSPEEITALYSHCHVMAIVDLKATVIYCGAKVDELAPLYKPFFDLCKKGMKEGGNLFGDMTLDTQAINSKKVENYNPFKITIY